MAFPANIETPKVNWLPGETRGNHSAQHNMIANILLAIQNKIGVNGSTDTSSIQYFIANHSHSNFYTKTEMDDILLTKLRQFTPNKHIVLNRTTGIEEIKTVSDGSSFLDSDTIRVRNSNGNFSDIPGSALKVTPIFGGDGSDGMLTGDVDITLTGNNDALIVKNYSGIGVSNVLTRAYTNSTSVAPGNNIVFLIADTSIFTVGRYVRVSSSAGAEIAKITAISTNVSITVDTTTLTHTNSSPLITLLRRLTVSNQNTILVLKVKGNADLSGWYIDLEGKGGQGGAGGSGGGIPGQNGANGISFIENIGIGGYGGPYQSYTSAQIHKGISTSLIPYTFNYFVQPGSGGGGGGGNQANPNNAPGGNGGGGLVIECTGTITSPSIVSGSKYKTINLNGQSVTTSGVTGSGGGGGGSAVIYYKTGVSGSISISYTGGTGNVGTNVGYGSGGGNGGSSLYNVGLAGTGSYNSSTTGGTGGAGGHILQQITYL